MMHVIQVCDCSSQALDSCSRAVFSACHRNVDFRGASKRAFDVIVDFGSALAQVRPFIRLFCESVLVGSFSTPDYAGRCSSWVEAGVGAVAFVGVAELAMDLRVRLW